MIKGPICALCLCEQNFPRKTAFAFLEDVANEFLNQNGTRVDTVARPYHFLEFGACYLSTTGIPMANLELSLGLPFCPEGQQFSQA